MCIDGGHAPPNYILSVQRTLTRELPDAGSTSPFKTLPFERFIELVDLEETSFVSENSRSEATRTVKLDTDSREKKSATSLTVSLRWPPS